MLPNNNRLLSSQAMDDDENLMPNSKSHPSFHIYLNHTLLGQSFLEALNELCEPGSKVYNKAIAKFEEAILNQFENMHELIPDASGNPLKASQENSNS